jgi:hypothetical protein
MVVTATDAQTTGLDARDRTAELAAVVLRGHSAIPDEYAAVADPGPAGTSRAREIYPLSDEQAADAPKPLHSHHPAGLAPRPPHSTPSGHGDHGHRHGRLPRALPRRAFPSRYGTLREMASAIQWI